MNPDNTMNTGQMIINQFASWVPPIIAVIIVLIIGYFVAWVVKWITTAILRGFKLNKRIANAPQGNIIHRIAPDLTGLIGSIVFWITWLIVITLGVLAAHVTVLDQAMYQIYLYIPNLLAALLILIVAILLAAGSAALVNRLMGDTPTGRIIAAVAPTLIMAISIFMILVQLGIATSIVIITYAAIMGALSLGFALAFGLGGRDLASRMLEGGYKSAQDRAGQVRSDMQKAKERGQKEADNLKEKYQKKDRDRE